MTDAAEQQSLSRTASSSAVWSGVAFDGSFEQPERSSGSSVVSWLVQRSGWWSSSGELKNPVKFVTP
ncbi:hypothetical protein NY406_03435 [Chlorobaculum sp. MV4-Y]|uniref:hypothetical protein n=1 Tax=Chlorobaculum sp. MV4-Y TaxID=2976335 RepID=UPI0021AE5E22|nr:hypothetical protein [Chlorobaculum sp. MV4-Y]UWX58337.1 hypothetical protein NY406_03435 [Chlorobaculum sp. MV4-Y]